MRHSIPSPRRSDDDRPLATQPHRAPLAGPFCPLPDLHDVRWTPSEQTPSACGHPSCRERRAQSLPRLGGHRSEFAVEHARAAAVQARHRDLIVYFGEATQSFWAITPTDMVEAPDVDFLLSAVRSHTDPPVIRLWIEDVDSVPALASTPVPASTWAPTPDAIPDPASGAISEPVSEPASEPAAEPVPELVPA